MTKPKRPIGETLGGIIVGFDYQVMRTTPPPWELVNKGQAVRGVTGEDGSMLSVALPDDEVPADDSSSETR